MSHVCSPSKQLPKPAGSSSAARAHANKLGSDFEAPALLPSSPSAWLRKSMWATESLRVRTYSAASWRMQGGCER